MRCGWTTSSGRCPWSSSPPGATRRSTRRSPAPTASSRSRSTRTTSAPRSRSCSLTLARRMWLASAALAAPGRRGVRRPHPRRLGAARGDRAGGALEGRHDGVAAVGEARLGRRDGLPRFHRHAHELPRAVPERRRELPCASRAGDAGRTTRQRARVRTLTMRSGVPGRLRRAADPVAAEAPGLASDAGLAQEGKLQTDEIRRLFRSSATSRTSSPPQAAADAGARTARRHRRASSVRASMALITLFGIVLARSIGARPRGGGGANRLAGGELEQRLPAGRPRRDRRADARVQLDGGEAGARPRGAGGAEPAAARERADEVRAGQHRLPRAPHAARERARFHLAAADAGLRPGDAPPLPRHRRRAGAAARGAARGLPRRAANRAEGVELAHGDASTWRAP